MRRYWKTIFFAIIFLILLIFVVFLLKKDNSKQTQNVIFETDISNISSINVISDFSYEVKKDTNGYGLYIPEKVPTKTGVLDGIVKTAAKLEYELVIDNSPKNYQQYGITSNNSNQIVKITTGTGSTKTIYIGDNTPTNDGFYVKAEDKPTVYKVSETVVNQLTQGVDDLIEKKIVSFDNDKINKISLKVGESSFEFNKKDNTWWYGNNGLNVEKTNEILDKIKNIEVDGIISKDEKIIDTSNPEIKLDIYKDNKPLIIVSLFNNEQNYYVIKQGISVQYYVSKYDIESIKNEMIRLYNESSGDNI